MSTTAENWEDPQKAEHFTLDPGSPDNKKFEEDLLAAKPGIHRAKYKGKDSYIAYAPVETTRWSVLFIMPVEAINAPIIPTEKAILHQAETVKGQVTNKVPSAVRDAIPEILSAGGASPSMARA